MTHVQPLYSSSRRHISKKSDTGAPEGTCRFSAHGSHFTARTHAGSPKLRSLSKEAAPARTPSDKAAASHAEYRRSQFSKAIAAENFDAEDLLVVLLLLLMAGDCREDQNSALLTLALYLFL